MNSNMEAQTGHVVNYWNNHSRAAHGKVIDTDRLNGTILIAPAKGAGFKFDRPVWIDRTMIF